MRPFYLIRIFVFLMFCWYITGEVAAQEGDTVKYSLVDTARALQLLNLGDSLLGEFKFDESLKLITQAKEIFCQLGISNEKTALCWRRIGYCLYFKGEYKNAMSAFDSSLVIYRMFFGVESEETLNVWSNIAETYAAMGNFTLSNNIHEKVIASKLSKNDCRSEIWLFYGKIGNNCHNMGKVESALEFHQKAFESVFNCLGNNNIEIANSLQNIGACYGSLLKFEKQIEYLEKALNIFKNYGDESSPDFSNCHNTLGVAYDDAGNFELGKIHLEKALELRRKYYGENSASAAVSYNNIAHHFSRLGDFQKAVVFYKKAIEISLSLPEENYYNIATFYNNLAVTFSNIGDIGKAIEYGQKSLNLRLKFFERNHPSIAYSYQNLALSYTNYGDYDKAIENFNLALKILSHSDDESTEIVIATIYNNLGFTYFKMSDYPNATLHHELSLELRKKLLGEFHPETASSFNNLANPLLLNGDVEKAIEYSKHSVSINRKYFGEFHPTLASNYSTLGDNYLKGNYFSQAEEAYKFSLKSLKFDNIDSLNKITSGHQLIFSLAAVASFYRNWYLNKQIWEHLKSSQLYYHLTFAALSHQTHTLSPASKSTLAAQAKDIFSGAVSTNLLLHTLTDSLHYLTEGFSFAERSKAMLLYEAMQETNALSVSGIPDSLLQQEYDLRVDIAYYDKKRQEKLSTGLNETDTTVLEITGKLFDLNREYEALKERFENDYPQYYKAKYDLTTIPLEEVQRELLQPNETMLEYMVGDSSIFIFLIQPDTFEVHEIKHDFPLADWVQQMTKDGIYGYYTAPEIERRRRLEETTIVNYTEAAQQLYQKLISPVAERLTENLIIIPDGVLGYVPFEALLSGKPNNIGRFSEYPFMVKDHQISYCYSATLLKEMRDKQHRGQPTGQLLAMAPFFDGDVSELTAHIDSTDLMAAFLNRDSLGTLPGSGEEVAAVNKLWNGTSIIGDGASLAEFQQQSADHRILHLSTHGKADDRVGDYAYLAFGVPGKRDEFDKLYARDLYNYSLNADLVVLSACETGIGKLQRGEGIVSLARAFAYAGAKSIFPTLWQVNDAKTKDLMIGFHTYLKMGKPKDEALRLAKLDFLEKNKGQGSYDHPFFWAGMIGIGDMGAVE